MLITVIKIMPAVISLLTFWTAVLIVWVFHPGKVIVRTYERVNHQLKEVRRGIFHYDRTNHFLTTHGAVFHYGSWINPLKYMILRALSGMACFLIGSRVNAFAAIVLMVLGFQLPSILLIRMNQKDNTKMMPQLQSLYNTLQEQMKAGVYVTDALAECYRGIEKGRLRAALEALSGELLLRKSFPEAMAHFNESFNNSTIDALCVILVQAQESGQSVELLGDMAEQLKDMQAAALIKKKEKLNRIETFCIVGILSVVIGIIMYACITTMFQSISNL